MKSLFIIKIQSQSDVITNSSSELFIFDDKNSKEEVIELLNNVYPNWRDEYAEPVPFSEINKGSLWYLLPNNSCSDILDNFYDIIIDYLTEQKIQYKDFLCTSECDKLLKKFNEDLKTKKYELPEVEFARECGLEPEIFWDGFDNLKVEIKSSYNNDSKYLDCSKLEISEEGKEALIKANSNSWLLYSLDENPNWDHQEDLMEIATRIHLG
jgi:hypothetical protein